MLLYVFNFSLEPVLTPLIFVPTVQPSCVNQKRKSEDEFNLHTNIFFTPLCQQHLGELFALVYFANQSVHKWLFKGGVFNSCICFCSLEMFAQTVIKLCKRFQGLRCLIEEKSDLLAA